jgi:hypothetical protein
VSSTLTEGYLAKRKARVSLAKKFENSDKFDKLENFRSRNRTRGRLQSDVIEQRRGMLFRTPNLLLLHRCRQTMSPNAVVPSYTRQPNLKNKKLILNNLLHDHFTAESPYPFNREGKFLFKASDWKSVPRSFPGSPPEVAIIGRYKSGLLMTNEISCLKFLS